MNKLDVAFRELQTQVFAEGLFHRSYGYYAAYALCLVGGFALCITVLFLSDSLGIQCLNAIAFAFFTVQTGMLAHDLAHGQVFASSSLNRIAAIALWTLGVGLSASRWKEKHDQHHKEVNHIGYDPDLDVPFMFAEGAVRPQGLARHLVRYQHIVFFLMLPFIYPVMLFRSSTYLLAHFSPLSAVELLCIVLHYAALAYVVFTNLPVAIGCVFIGIVATVSAVYLSLVFAPNHKGEALIPEDREVRWIDQITSTRNLTRSRVLFHICGGLNFQIEHHLFPHMPRPHYWRANELVHDFCTREGIQYSETSWRNSMRLIYVSLREQAHAHTR